MVLVQCFGIFDHDCSLCRSKEAESEKESFRNLLRALHCRHQEFLGVEREIMEEEMRARDLFYCTLDPLIYS